MGRKIKSVSDLEEAEQALQQIKPLFENWPSVRWNKCLYLFQFAKQATGPIVELGCYDGNGTLALALGSQAGNNVPVYAIDKFERFTGLYQQQFYPEDEQRLNDNLRIMRLEDNVTIIKGDSETVAEIWPGDSINLLMWDISLPRLYEDWLCWYKYVNGLFLAKDTTTYDFGWQKVYKDAIERGWRGGPMLPEACLWGVRND